DDAGIHAVGADYFRIIGLSYPFMGVSMVSAVAFQGLGRATVPLVLMTTRVIGVLVVALYCTQWLGYGAHAVFLSVTAGKGVSGVAVVAPVSRTTRSLAKK